jgi:peptidoglycan-associated lipoprotein
MIFAEFECTPLREETQGDGDVKYHLGWSHDRRTSSASRNMTAPKGADAMLRFTFSPVVVLAVVAAPLLALGCAKPLAMPVAHAPRAGETTTSSPGGAPAGASSTTTAPLAGAAATPAAPSAAGAGAPAAPPSGPPASRPSPRDFVAVPDFEDIHFDFDRYDIRPDAARILDANARWMKANPGALVLIEGHADERGTNEYNLPLGERRAKAAMNYLVGTGLPAGRFTVISYGEEWPVCQEKNEACWARNRRAHFLAKPQ